MEQDVVYAVDFKGGVMVGIRTEDGFTDVVISTEEARKLHEQLWQAILDAEDYNTKRSI